MKEIKQAMKKDFRFKALTLELKRHAPFTFLGTLTGILIMFGIYLFNVPNLVSQDLFGIFHPAHVFFSAMVTTSVYCLHSKKCSFIKFILIGYFGSVGIATLSDCIIPFVGEWMLDLPHRGFHLGVIHRWWLVNPVAFAGILVARYWPKTKLPHMFHVLISTWASLFHMTMSLGGSVSVITFLIITLFLFIAVWVPCCTSDIIFPLLFAVDDKLTTEARI